MSKFNIGDSVRVHFGTHPKTPTTVAGVSNEKHFMYYIPYSIGLLPTQQEITSYGLNPSTRYRLIAEPFIEAV